MFRLILVAFVMLLPMSIYAQQFSINGFVKNQKTNQPLAGATIQVENFNRFAVTDAFGKFSLEKMPAGDYSLVIKFLGFADKVEKITLQKSAEITVLMEESVQVTDEVVVWSTRATDKTPATYTTVGKQAIQKQNFGQDLPFMLNWTPSVVTTSDAGTGVGYTGIRIRGSDATRINVTINGIPYNDSESQGTFWVDIPDIASSSQSIQIQRGVGTSTNGAGAFGASINLQTLSRNDDPYAEVVNSFGSFNTRRHTLSFGSGLLHDHWVIDGRISKIVSDGFIDRAAADLQSYYFAAGFYAGNTMIKGIMFGGKERTYQSWYGVPESRLQNNPEAMLVTAANEGWNEAQLQNLLTSGNRTFNPYTYKNQVDDYQQDHYQLHFSQRVTDAFTGTLSLHYTPGKGYYEEYRYDDAFEDYGLSPVTIGDSTIAATDLIRRRWLDNDFYGFTYALNYEKENWTGVLGGGWNRYEGGHFGEIIWSEVATVPSTYQYYFNRGDKKDFNIFLKATHQFTEKFSAYADLQWRKILYDASGNENRNPAQTFHFSEDYNFFNPKVGAVYAITNRQQVYASYSIGNREPVRDDFVDAPQGKRPKHETLRNLEAGYRVAGKNFNVSVNYYLMDYKNQLVLTGQLNDVGASIRTNTDKSYRTGFELEGLVKLSERFTWNANLTLSKNKIKAYDEVLYDYGLNYDEYNEIRTTYRNTDISFSPDIIAGSGLTFRFFKDFEALWLAKYVGRQYLDNTENKNRSLDPYFINDIRLTYTLNPSFMREIGISFLLNNVFSEKYESNGYTWGYAGGGEEFRENYYFPQAGRNFLAMVTLKF